MRLFVSYLFECGYQPVKPFAFICLLVYTVFFKSQVVPILILAGSAEVQRKNPNERILVWKIGWVLEIADQVF